MKRMNGAEAEALAARALAFMAGDEALIGRFLGASGAAAGDLRARASDPEFLGFVLDFLLAEEEALVAFAAGERIAPEAVLGARAALPGGLAPEWT